MSEDPAAKLERLRADMAKTKERIAAIRASHNNMTPVNGDQPAGMLLLSLSLSLSLSRLCGLLLVLLRHSTVRVMTIGAANNCGRKTDT
jgi:hypothetical protein